MTDDYQASASRVWTMLNGGLPPRADLRAVPLVLLGIGSVIAQPFVDYALAHLNVVGIVDNPTAGTQRGGLRVLDDAGLADLLRTAPDAAGVTCCCSDGPVAHFDRQWAAGGGRLYSLFEAAAATMGDLAPGFSAPDGVASLLERRDVWEAFADDFSRSTYFALLAHRLTWERRWLEPLRLPYRDMYFFTDALSVGDDETLVDGGAFDGDTVALFAEKTAGRYRMIHAFEVDPANAQALRRRTADMPQVAVHVMGLWREAGELRLSSGRGAGSALGQGDMIVPVAAMDGLDLGPVSFIKLDVEGAEIAVLEGAAETIRRYKPKLALAAYHAPDDLVAIVDAVRTIRPDYAFRLRHHAPIYHDTVLYAE